MESSSDLSNFVQQRAGFSWRRGARYLGHETLHLSSGIWMGVEWSHDIVLVRPAASAIEGVFTLYITGGNPNPLDIQEAQAISNLSGVPVAMLFHIPNQPIWEMWEDDLIAHTFQNYLETGDSQWPLLFPMVRAAVRCMDALQEYSEGSISRFVVTGASKRGWTTWLAAATCDRRIIGIAPMVLDNLNVSAQMQHQVETWGDYSEQIRDYTERGLQNAAESERGAALTRMMDPYYYLEAVKCPVLIINGGNDRYWTVDALSLYWDAISDPKSCLVVPNVGHILGDKVQMIETLSQFAQRCASQQEMPNWVWAIERSGNALTADGGQADELRLWTAESETMDFRDSVWTCHQITAPYPLKRNTAVMVEARWRSGSGGFSLTSPVKVFGL